MFLIDSKNKKATPIVKKTFEELGFTERYDVQEWICGNPEILGEQLLIIQKEFAGFSDTNERLDLLVINIIMLRHCNFATGCCKIKESDQVSANLFM